MQFIFGVFMVLHGLVHLLYFGHSARRFELRPGMVWPDGSWAFSRLPGDQAIRNLASIACVVAAIGFVVGGIALLLSQVWWHPVVAAAAALSAVLYILFWDGKRQRLDDQGGVGVLIDLAILMAVLVVQLPLP